MVFYIFVNLLQIQVYVEKMLTSLAGCLICRNEKDQYKPLTLDPQGSIIVNALLNSSLFYWWFVIWSDGRHLLAQHIKSFFTDLDTFPKDMKDRLKLLVDDLMRSNDLNSNVKINERSGGYAIRIKEIVPSRSRHIIDQIDNIFAEYFEFTDEESEFIKKFDIGFRIDSTT